MKTKSVKLTLISTDCGIQTRCGINEETVADYCQDFLNGVQFPPIDVFTDGNGWFLVDGFHRVLAAKRAEFKDILATIHDGTRSDAVLYALSKANAVNGMRRTRDDKEYCVKLALKECPEKSDNWIAETLRVSHNTVAKYRSQVVICQPDDKRVGKNGVAQAAHHQHIESKEPPKVETTEPAEPIPSGATPETENVVSQFIANEQAKQEQLAQVQREEHTPTVTPVSTTVQLDKSFEKHFIAFFDWVLEDVTSHPEHEAEVFKRLAKGTANLRDILSNRKQQ